MSKKDEALKLALEALEWINRVNAMGYEYKQKARESLNAIYEALAEQQTDWEAVAADQAMTIALLRAEQPAQQEPVAWLIWLHGPAGHFDHKQFAELEFERRNKEYPDPDRKLLPLYTSPPAQRTWVGLTDEEIERCMKQAYATVQGRNLERAFARAIEAKLRERNGIKGDA